MELSKKTERNRQRYKNEADKGKMKKKGIYKVRKHDRQTHRERGRER